MESTRRVADATGVAVRSALLGVVGVAVAMPVDERGGAVGITSLEPAVPEVLELDDFCVGEADAATTGVAVAANGLASSVSCTTGVKVALGLKSGVSEPSSGTAAVTLPTGPAKTTVFAGVASSPTCIVGSGVGVSVSSPTFAPCSTDGAGVALTVTVIPGATATAVVEVTVTGSVSIGAALFGGLPGATRSLPSH